MARILNTALLEPGNRYATRSLTRNESDWIYNGLDCCVTLEVLHQIKPQLDNVTTNTYEFSKSLQGPILEMQQRGMLVDKKRRNEVLASYRKQILNIEVQLLSIIEDGIGLQDFNWRSPAQLIRLFYNVLELKAIRKRNVNGVMAPTVNRDALEKLSNYIIAEPLTNRLLLLRDIDKKRQWLETEIDSDGRMRTNFNIAGTNTGRLASAVSDFGTGGNMQNVDRELRSVFVADPGKIFVNLDLEQGDSRNLGACCWEIFVHEHGEKWAGSYLDACESGDLHTTVSRMARPNLPWTDDAKENRRIADQKFYRNDSYRDLDKKLGHGSNYIGQPKTMARHSKVPVSEVEQFQKNYFTAFACIPKYHGYVRQELEDYGFLTTIYGRRRKFFGRSEDDATIREAVAYRPQSMTADCIDTGLIRLFNANRVQLLAQVHDSILLQCDEPRVNEIVPWAIELLRVRHVLAKGREFVIPPDAKVGYNWAEVITWSQTDFIKGLCKQEDIGKDKENLDGLRKWKGEWKHTRLEQKKLSIRDYLDKTPRELA